MRNKIILSLLFIAFSCIGFSQLKPDIIIKTSPLDLLTLYPGLGIELKLSKNHSLLFEHSFMSSNHNKGTRNKLEFRQYIDDADNDTAPMSGTYIGLMGMYKDQEVIHDADLLDVSGSYTDKVLVHKQKTAINIKLGYQFCFDVFYLDINSGIGVAYKEVEYSDVDIIDIDDDTEIDLGSLFFGNREGERYTPNILFNVKVGVKL